MDNVIFRRRKKDGHIFAVFLDQKGSRKDTLLAYDKKLVESEIVYKWFMRDTVKVKPIKYRDFKKKLEVEGGFKINVRKQRGGGGAPKIDPDRTEKKCSICRKVLPRSEFPQSRKAKDNMHSACTLCSGAEISARILSKEPKRKLNEKIKYHQRVIDRILMVKEGMTPREVARAESKNRVRKDPDGQA